MGCWASGLGGCAGKLSREHLVTESFWQGENISVVGFPWCKTNPKEVGTAAIVSKVLCRSHNSALSPVDAAGAHAFREFEAAETLMGRRRRLPEREWFRHCFEVDGSLLERWFLKTAINLSLVRDEPTQWAMGNDADRPPLPLVRAAFGQELITKPLGLYSAASVGQSVRPLSGLAFMPLFWNDHGLAAGLFEFRGFRFILNLVGEPLPAVLPDMPGGASEWGGSTVSFHLNRINNDIGRARSHFVDFTWPKSWFAHFAP
jgi:hypothetical protein